jgi:hypothetical protein
VSIPKDRKQTDPMYVSYLPFTLFPTPFRRSHFEQVFDLQPHINNLINKLSKSSDILEKNFET